MLNKDKWFNNYINLSSESQIEIASKIIEELYLNEKIFTDDEYDHIKSNKLRELFKKLKVKLNNNKELDDIDSIINRFNNLNDDNQLKVIKLIYKDFVDSLSEVELNQLQSDCEKKGHKFGKWKKYSWTEYSDEYIDHQFVHNYPTNYTNWERECSICGFIESSDIEPQELIDSRKEKNRKVKIKRLERELKRLKNE